MDFARDRLASVYSANVIDLQLTPCHEFLSFSLTKPPSTRTLAIWQRHTVAFPPLCSFVSSSFDAPFSLHCMYQFTWISCCVVGRQFHPSDSDGGISLLIHFSTVDASHAANSHHDIAHRRLHAQAPHCMRFTCKCKIRSVSVVGLLFHATPTFGHFMRVQCSSSTRIHTHTPHGRLLNEIKMS